MRHEEKASLVPARDSGGGTVAHTLASLVTGAPDYAAVFFYQADSLRNACFLLCSVITCGVLPIVTMWVPQWYTVLTKRRVASATDETGFVLVQADAKTATGAVWEECVLQTQQGTRWFEYRKSRHYFDAKKQSFMRLKNELQERYGEIQKRAKLGFTEEKAEELGTVYGPNEINVAAMPWNRVLLRKVLHPFYLFQVASVLIWFNESYSTYAIVIMVMSAISIAWEVYSQVSSDNKLHALCEMDASVRVMRDQRLVSVSVSKLVVGDIVWVEEGLVPADIVMIAGECTADESTLTGEAIPITKQDLNHPDGFLVDTKIKTTFKESVLYAGSTILTTKPDNSSRGIVLCTGFSTSKGELFRSIIYPKSIKFRIESDSYRFMAALSLVAILAFIKRMVQATKAGVSTGEAVSSSLDLVTIAVPPALPLILTIGVGFALTRLEAADIFCINSQRVNLAGHLDTFCFDKTGTLSSDHLDFQGVDECAANTTTFSGLQSEVDVLSITAIVGLATCHGLNERNGNITGYALERDMFRATGYSIESNVHKKNTPNAPFSVLISSPIGKTFGVVKRYLFDATLQRSSVLIEDFESGQRVVYTKGSPEAMLSICNPASIPINYHEKVRAYSYQGYYVVALASKTYPVTTDLPQREAMECRLTFVGYILFLNKIKSETPYVISSLEDAHVDVRIITGDNAFTAIHVARKINMELKSSVLMLDVDPSPNLKNQLVFADVDDLATQATPEWTAMDNRSFITLGDNNEFAVTGAAIEALQATQSEIFVQDIVAHTKIFARIRPQQKTWIIETLIERGRCVGMVGDGTNDCGALKAAHVGIALSDADASIVAPFTSRKKQITDVVTLLREGRCALSTSFAAFKYMVLYSIIQVTMSSLMEDYSSQMSNNQFLFDDVVVVFGLSILMVRTAAAERLTVDLPAKTLFAPTILASLGGQIIFFLCCLGIAISAAKTKSWYCSAAHALELTKTNSSAIKDPCYVFVPGTPEDLTQHSYENSVLWLFGHLQYWIVALAFNAQDVFRKPMKSNVPFVLYVAFLFIVLQVQLFSYKSEQTTQTVGVDTSFGVLKLPGTFCTSLFFLFLFDLLLATTWEVVVVGVALHRFQQQRQYAGAGRGWFIAGTSQTVAPYADRDSLLHEYDSADKDDEANSKPSALLTEEDDGEEQDVLKANDMV